MADTVKAVEKHKLLYPSKRQEKSDDVIWKLDQCPTQGHTARQTSSPTGGPKVNRYMRAPNRSSTRVKCYNCNESGHVRKDCQICSYCKKYGHTAKICPDRIAKAKGKFCHECKISDSHNTDECFKSSRPSQQRERHKNIRMVVEDTTKESTHENEWASNLYESGSETPPHYWLGTPQTTY